MASNDNDKMRVDSPSDDTMRNPHMGLGRYLATRLPTLKSPLARAPNPFLPPGDAASSAMALFSRRLHRLILGSL